MALGAADYRVSFLGTFSSGAIRFDVFDATDGVVLAEVDRIRQGPASITFNHTMSFSVGRERQCHEIEFRMHVELPWPGRAELHYIRLMRDTNFRL